DGPEARRADAHGTLRRDLPRGPAERRGAQGDLRRSSPQAEARPEAVRPRRPRRRVGRLQRRGDRAGGRRRPLHRVLARRGGQLAVIAEELKATKPLSVTRAETISALREWARDRTVMA